MVPRNHTGGVNHSSSLHRVRIYLICFHCQSDLNSPDQGYTGGQVRIRNLIPQAVEIPEERNVHPVVKGAIAVEIIHHPDTSGVSRQIPQEGHSRSGAICLARNIEVGRIVQVADDFIVAVADTSAFSDVFRQNDQPGYYRWAYNQSKRRNLGAIPGRIEGL